MSSCSSAESDKSLDVFIHPSVIAETSLQEPGERLISINGLSSPGHEDSGTAALQVVDHVLSSNEEGPNCTDVSRKLSGFGKWSSRATQLFLQMMLQEADKLRNPYIKQRDIWRHISQELIKEDCHLVPEHVERKWHNLLRTYRINKRQRNNANGFKVWDYYEMMDKIMGSLPDSKTSSKQVMETPTTNPQFLMTDSISTELSPHMSTSVTQIPSSQTQNLSTTSTLIVLPASSSVPPPNGSVLSVSTPVTGHSHFLSPLLPKTSQQGSTSSVTLTPVLPSSQPYCPPAFPSPSVCFSEQRVGSSDALPSSSGHPIQQPDSPLDSSSTLYIKQEVEDFSSITMQADNPESQVNGSLASLSELVHLECKPERLSPDALPSPPPQCQLENSSNSSLSLMHSKRRRLSNSVVIESGNCTSTLTEEMNNTLQRQGVLEETESMKNENNDAHMSDVQEHSKVLMLIYQSLQENNKALERFNNGLHVMHADMCRLSSAVESLTQALNKK